MINEIDLKALWQELDIYEREVDKESSTLKDVWRKITELKAKNDDDEEMFVS